MNQNQAISILSAEIRKRFPQFEVSNHGRSLTVSNRGQEIPDEVYDEIDECIDIDALGEAEVMESVAPSIGIYKIGYDL